MSMLGPSRPGVCQASPCWAWHGAVGRVVRWLGLGTAACEGLPMAKHQRGWTVAGTHMSLPASKGNSESCFSQQGPASSAISESGGAGLIYIRLISWRV